MARSSTSLSENSEASVVSFEKRKRARTKSPNTEFFTSEERRQAVAFILIAIAAISFASLVLNPSELRGISSSETPSAAGRIGRWIAVKVGLVFGIGGLLLPAISGLWGGAIFRRTPPRVVFAKGLALTLCLLSTCALLGLVYPEGWLGGALGDRLSADLREAFGLVSYLIVVFALMVSAVIGTPLSFSTLTAAMLAGAGRGWKTLAAMERRVAERFVTVREAKRSRERPKFEATQEPGSGAPLDDGHGYFEKAETRVIATPALRLLKKKEENSALANQANAPSEPLSPPPPARAIFGSNPTAPESPIPSITIPEDDGQYTDLASFTLPSLDILRDPQPTDGVNEEYLKSKARLLQLTLSEFDIECKVGDIVPGPTVTRFEVVPAPGVKVSSITARADDIALAMAAPSIRIEAPIPGKTAVGIEIPNRQSQEVLLKEVITSDEFQAARKLSPLAVALGLDIAGRSVIADLRTMPHLLIAGATGSGKSVCINTIVNSLILTSRPTDVRLLMIDPKVVELQDYNEVPHLIAPVVTNVRQAPKALMWAAQEMEKRYQILAEAGVRDIDSYNALAAEHGPAACEKSEEEPDEFIDTEDELIAADEIVLPDRMPYIVVIVDEFCDLMMLAKKECEDAIVQMASMARAVGIHLIIATQRPSVDVITGVIKANLPARICFLVSSRVDSQTVLDKPGAERLLGRGDMLYKPSNFPKPIRLQGSFIRDEEIKAILKHYSDQGAARREFLLEDGMILESGPSLSGEDDPLLEQALWIVLQDGHASVSRLQRRLKVGHPRAARLVDIMEAKGLVTKPDGSKPRELLFDKEYLTRNKTTQG